MQKGSCDIHISLLGQFRIETADGDNLTPRGAKAQGLLALLASGSNMRRSRTWLQDKLWSDRGQQQASASLRQSIAEIKKCFGKYAHIMNADRRSVSLNMEKVTLSNPISVGNMPLEFLEGIDIRDAEFEDWLRLARSKDGAKFTSNNISDGLSSVAKPKPRGIILKAHNNFPSSLHVLENQFIDSVTKSLREFHSAEIFLEEPEQASHNLLIVLIQAYEFQGSSLGLRVIVQDVDSNKTLWSENVISNEVSGPISQCIDHFGLGHQLVSALSDILTKPTEDSMMDNNASLFANMALRKMFTMRHEDLVEAETLLEKAAEIENRGIFHAWRAQLAAIQFIEQQGACKKELSDKSKHFCTLAMTEEPHNSNVLSAVANSKLVFENNVIASAELAKLGVEINPGNPLAWWALANANLYSEEKQEAYKAAKMAQRLSERSPFRFWSDFQVSLIAAVTGRLDEAKKFGELSSSLASSFRPPMRYLTALYALEGDIENATRTAENLTSIEHKFSIDRMINDAEYPISMMRKSGLLNTARLSEIDT